MKKLNFKNGTVIITEGIDNVLEAIGEEYTKRKEVVKWVTELNPLKCITLINNDGDENHIFLAKDEKGNNFYTTSFAQGTSFNLEYRKGWVDLLLEYYNTVHDYDKIENILNEFKEGEHFYLRYHNGKCNDAVLIKKEIIFDWHFFCVLLTYKIKGKKDDVKVVSIRDDGGYDGNYGSTIYPLNKKNILVERRKKEIKNEIKEKNNKIKQLKNSIEKLKKSLENDF